MEKKIVLLYGSKLPPYKHIEKISQKYWRYYERDQRNGNYEENEFFEVWVSFHFTDSVPEKFTYVTLCIPIRRSFLSKLYSIFEALECNVQLCDFTHSHPTTEVLGITYEGYCYRCSNGTKLLFINLYCDENGHEDTVFELEWYRKLPEDKRWYIAKKEEDPEKAFEQWVVNQISPNAASS
ncbi:hypothetical protein [Paenibacillus turpanensis]|uniref:hypothetical protein n=1 Tax=Paenibacillus turpanensis TaxID=2689078 RepID=UPI001407844F|nr:hypothetical protein [Paenibacillus turpanensis]